MASPLPPPPPRPLSEWLPHSAWSWKRLQGRRPSAVADAFRGRSIQASLLRWTTALLAAVVLGFGGSLYWRVRQATFDEIDADLHGAAQLLAQRVADEGLAASWEIPEIYRRRFGPGPKDRAYFIVWNAAGQPVHRSETAPADAALEPEPPPPRGPRTFHSRSRGELRELIVRGPEGSQLLVGRPIHRETNRLNDLLGWTLLAGGVVLAAGAIGARQVAASILGPVAAMTSAAERISAQNLSERIPPAQASEELDRLASVLNAAFDRLEASFARQVRFTADASHELRTPLSVIYASAELALARDRSPLEYRDALAGVLRAAKRMRGLVQSLLTLARIDGRPQEGSRARLRLDQLAAETLELLRPLAQERQVRLEADLAAVEVFGDPRQLGQAATNLVQNAILHNRPGGMAGVSVRQEGAEARLAVRDDGVGVSEADLPRLFERFFRADPARSAEAGGSGLGLAVAQEWVLLHGGRIDVQSTLGVGSTFTMILPAAPPLPAPPAEAPDPPPSPLIEGSFPSPPTEPSPPPS